MPNSKVSLSLLFNNIKNNSFETIYRLDFPEVDVPLNVPMNVLFEEQNKLLRILEKKKTVLEFLGINTSSKAEKSVLNLIAQEKYSQILLKIPN